MFQHFYFALKRFGKAFSEKDTKVHLGRWNLNNNKELSLYFGNIDNHTGLKNYDKKNIVKKN